MSGNFLSKINPVQNKLFLKNLVHKTLSLFYELREKVIDCLVENNESIQNNYEHRYELLVNNDLLKFEQELTKSISKKTILFSFVKAAQLSDKVTKD